MSARFTPPAFVRRLLVAALPTGMRGETIVGDLDEEFRHRAARSQLRAALWYWRAAFGVSLRMSADRWRRRHTDPPPPPRASLMDTLLQDIRQGAYTLARARRFTTASLATLAIGIGAATAIFSVVNAMVLRPLPYPNADRLLWAAETLSTGGVMTLSWPNYQDWHARLTSFEAIGASRRVTYTLTDAGDAMRLEGRQVTWDFLPVLGVTPAVGRPFQQDDDRPSPVHPVLLSDSFWSTTLGRDPNIVGRKLTIDGQPHEVIGVLPPGFRYVVDYAVYEPVGVVGSGDGLPDRGNHVGLVAVGRLKPGVTEAAARQEVQALAVALSREYPNSNSGQSAHVETLASRFVGDLQPRLIALFVAVGLLLLIACVNVANLLIAHGATRRHEMAVRSALGGSRLRLIRQLLVESMLLSTVGGVLGVAVGAALLQALLAVAPATLPRIEEVRLDGVTLLFALSMTVLSGLVFGTLPAIIASRAGSSQMLVRAGRAGVAGSHRLRRGLVMVEVALAVVVLCGSGLMIRTMWRLTNADPGFTVSNLITAKYGIRGGAKWTEAAIRTFHDDVVARARALPGVTDVALTYSLPFEGSNWGSVFVVGDQPVPARADIPSAAFNPVSAGFFSTLGLKLKEGRVFTDADRENAPTVAVVSERFAKRFWPNESAIGKRLKQGWPEWTTPWREIVGVVNDVKLNGVENDAPLLVYLPLMQQVSPSVILIARTNGTTAGTGQAIRQLVTGLSNTVPVYDIRTMDEVFGVRVGQQRLTMIVFAVFGGVALVLAAVGLYGVVSHGVADRTREIGVRVALGATPRQVLRLFLSQGAITTTIGIVVGAGAALGLTRFLSDLLFETTPNDPLTIAAVVVSLFAVSIAACYLPALRATRVDPTSALRGE